jgi:hypothetical protein
MERFHQAQDRDKWQDFVNVVMIPRTLHSVQLDAGRGWARHSGAAAPTEIVQAAVKGTL